MTQVKDFVFTTYNLENFRVPDEDHRFEYCVYQAEQCPDTGNIHLQGFIIFKRSIRWTSVKKLCNDNTMHLEIRLGTRVQARDYCMKTETRYADPIEFGVFNDLNPRQRTDLIEARKIILTKRKRDDLYQDPLLDNVMTKYPRWAETIQATKPVEYVVDIELYEWQCNLMLMFAEPPVHRRIIWIWSQSSKTGKTTFKDYVSTKFDVLPCRGKFADILYAYDNNEIIWFDFTRAQCGYESYDSLEELSNIGFKLSTKYTTIRKFVKAHVVVTSNHPPDETRLPERFYVLNVDPQRTINTALHY